MAGEGHGRGMLCVNPPLISRTPQGHVELFRGYFTFTLLFDKAFPLEGINKIKGDCKK
jgi:hypothetical protein